MYGQVTNSNADNIETKTNGNLNRASALMSQSAPSSILHGARSTGPSTPRKDLTMREGIKIFAVEAVEAESVEAAMEVQEVEDHGKEGRTLERRQSPSQPHPSYH